VRNSCLAQSSARALKRGRSETQGASFLKKIWKRNRRSIERSCIIKKHILVVLYKGIVVFRWFMTGHLLCGIVFWFFFKKMVVANSTNKKERKRTWSAYKNLGGVAPSVKWGVGTRSVKRNPRYVNVKICRLSLSKILR
jgi:hypothetical protein